MNKTELIDHIAKQADISKAAAGRALEAIVAGIRTSLKKGNSVTLVGFGTFMVGKRAARTGRNPRTNRTDQDQGCARSEVPSWQGAERFAKLAVFRSQLLLLVSLVPTVSPGCLAQLVERRPYKA